MKVPKDHESARWRGTQLQINTFASRGDAGSRPQQNICPPGTAVSARLQVALPIRCMQSPRFELCDATEWA
eukprot:485195-Pleurochrysis_carterae.AAC.6